MLLRRPIATGALLGATGSYTPVVTIIDAGFATAAGAAGKRGPITDPVLP
jgi:hypothetical protein